MLNGLWISPRRPAAYRITQQPSLRGLLECLVGRSSPHIHVPHITRGPGHPSGRNCPATKRFARRRGLGSASRHGDGLPYIAHGRASLSPDGVISGTAVPHITPGPGSRMGRRRPASLDFVAASGGSRRGYAAWFCRISPAGPPSPIAEPILGELLSIAHSGYTTAPSEARRRGRMTRRRLNVRVIMGRDGVTKA